MRVRLIVPTTFHPDAGGTRRRGEVFDLAPDLAAHWIRQDIAEDAMDAELTPPRVAATDPEPEPWDIPSLDPDAPDQRAVVNGDDRPAVSTKGMAARKQRRG
jgi:hypothetical protein